MPDTETAGSEEASPEYMRMFEAERYWWHRIASASGETSTARIPSTSPASTRHRQRTRFCTCGRPCTRVSSRSRFARILESTIPGRPRPVAQPAHGGAPACGARRYSRPLPFAADGGACRLAPAPQRSAPPAPAPTGIPASISSASSWSVRRTIQAYSCAGFDLGVRFTRPRLKRYLMCPSSLPMNASFRQPPDASVLAAIFAA